MRRDYGDGSRAASALGFMALCAMLLASGVFGVAATVPSTPVHAQSFSGLGGVSADGTVVVGSGDATGFPNGEAFRWTQAGGMQSVQALLTAKGVSTTGWTLDVATGVSADGQVIVGVGTNPSGHTQGSPT